MSGVLCGHVCGIVSVDFELTVDSGQLTVLLFLPLKRAYVIAKVTEGHLWQSVLLFGSFVIRMRKGMRIATPFCGTARNDTLLNSLHHPGPLGRDVFNYFILIFN